MKIQFSATCEIIINDLRHLVFQPQVKMAIDNMMSFSSDVLIKAPRKNVPKFKWQILKALQ